MAYIVIRRYGVHGADYLSGFDSTWGTVQRGSRPLRFPTYSAARAAARKARRVCTGWNAAKQRPRRARMTFEARAV